MQNIFRTKISEYILEGKIPQEISSIVSETVVKARHHSLHIQEVSNSSVMKIIFVMIVVIVIVIVVIVIVVIVIAVVVETSGSGMAHVKSNRGNRREKPK